MINAQTTDAEHINRWLVPNPQKPGAAEMWVLPAYVSVWVIVQQLELEHQRVAVVAEMYELPVEAIEAAEAFYRQHRAEIDERIKHNRAFFTAP